MVPFSCFVSRPVGIFLLSELYAPPLHVSPCFVLFKDLTPIVLQSVVSFTGSSSRQRQ